MKSIRFVMYSGNRNRDEIEKLLGLDLLKDEIDELKKDNEMLKRIIETFFKSLKSDDGGKLEELKEKNRELRREKEELKERVSFLEGKSSNLESEMKRLQVELKKVTEDRKNDKLDRLKRVYDSLDEQTKSRIETILKPYDKLSLLVSGVLNIGSVWDYAAHLRREHKDSEFEKLREIFYLLFEEYEKIKRVSLQEVAEREKFDDDLFSRDNRSEAMSGVVEEVVLRGFLENGKIIKKSIVKVK